MNLGPPSTNPRNQRPYQSGHANGFKSGSPTRLAVEWLIDTGSDIGVVRSSVGNHFDLTPTAASASPTTGGGGIIVKTGLEAEFTAEDHTGRSVVIRATQAVGVKSGNTGSDIIGVDQLAANVVEVEWNAATQTGTLRISSSGSSASSTSTASIGASSAGGGQRSAEIPPQIVDHGAWIAVGGTRIDKQRG